MKRLILAIVGALCLLVGGTILWNDHHKEKSRKDRVMVISATFGPETRYSVFSTPETDPKEIELTTNLIAKWQEIKRKNRLAEEEQVRTNQLSSFRGKLSVALKWDPSLDPDVVGYRVCQGNQDQAYTNVVDAGNSTTLTIGDLAPGATYYFGVVAYDRAGIESKIGERIMYVAP